MSFWILCLLCIVQGLTEFLPVSSSGHLLLVEQIFGIEDTLLLNLFLHVATLCAVIVVYRKTIWGLLKKPFQPLTYKLLLSTLITVIIAVGYELLHLDQYGFKIYGFCFLITSIVLGVTFLFQKKGITVKSDNEIGVKSAVLVGFVQGLAVFPGISRSGSTISSLILAGNDEEKASEFSFLLSIPVILGGFVLELIKLIKGGSTTNAFATISPWLCVFAFIFTFFVAFASLKLTLKLLKKHKFIYFAIYLFLLAITVITLNFTIFA